MSIDKVRNYFKEYNIEDNIIELSTSTATVKEAAESLGTEECRIAKSLSFIVEDKPIIIVVAGDAKIDNSKYKGYFHNKAKMIPFEEVNNLIGHNPGGVCPFAINEGVTVYLDESLKRFDYVYPACGSSNSAIKLTIEELEKYSNYNTWIDVCKY
ncbi:MAG: YbaK/EbsC family protein [Firmicutes bacterium]|nr:YbaK/EbsC family protein [Bacillota bacterium]